MDQLWIIEVPISGFFYGNLSICMLTFQKIFDPRIPQLSDTVKQSSFSYSDKYSFLLTVASSEQDI